MLVTYLSIPQAFGSSGGQVGTGMALVLAAETLVCAEAVAMWVEATAPVRARTTTNARTRVFILFLLRISNAVGVDASFCCYKRLKYLLLLIDTASIRIVRGAGRDWHGTGLGGRNFGPGGGGGGL